MSRQPGHTTRPHARLPPSFPGMVAWMTPQTNVSLVCKPRGPLMCLAFFDMLPMGVCTTRQLQTSGRLVHESNICTVGRYANHSTLGMVYISVSFSMTKKSSVTCVDIKAGSVKIHTICIIITFLKYCAYPFIELSLLSIRLRYTYS